MKTVVAMICGLLFGAGLEVSAMTEPAKVLAFLDVFGAWDPTLACVMGAALAVNSAGYAIARRRDATWLGLPFSLPTRSDLDGQLLGGAILFGIGWGLVGLCPGPALANLHRVSLDLGIFLLAMFGGVFGHQILLREPAAKLKYPAA